MASKSEVEEYLAKYPNFVKEWFLKNAGQKEMEECLDYGPKNAWEWVSKNVSGAFTTTDLNTYLENRTRKNSVDLDLIDQEHLRSMSETELFHTLIKDVTSRLDVNESCFRLLYNVGALTKSDRSSLFLVRYIGKEPFLVSKLLTFKLII